MRRLAGLLALLVILVGASAARPATCIACYCLPPESLRAAVADPRTTLFSGAVGGTTGAFTTFFVDRWFVGTGMAPAVRLRPGTVHLANGTSVMNTCGVDFAPGSRVILAAWRDDEGVLVPSICSPYGDLSKADGQALLAEAIRTFGPGEQPGAGPTEDAPAAPAPSEAAAAVVQGATTDASAPVALVGGAAVGALLIAVTALMVARRARRRSKDA